MKMMENENICKYYELARELIELRKIKVTMILLVVGSLGTVPNGLGRKLDAFKVGGLVDTNETKVMLRLESSEWFLRAELTYNHSYSGKG